MGFDNLVRAALIAAIPILYAKGSLQLGTSSWGAAFGGMLLQYPRHRW
jgi:hypothetical protein